MAFLSWQQAIKLLPSEWLALADDVWILRHPAFGDFVTGRKERRESHQWEWFLYGEDGETYACEVGLDTLGAVKASVGIYIMARGGKCPTG